MRVGRAGDAGGPDSWIDLLGEGPVLDEAARFAGIILEPFLLPRRLDAAIVHPEEETPRPLFDNRLDIDPGVEAETERPLQTGKSNSPIAAKLIVFTGAMKSGSREELKSQAKALGARIAASVTGKTDILVIGENVGAVKMNDAKEKGVEIITEDEYLARISRRPEKLMAEVDLHSDKQLSLFS